MSNTGTTTDTFANVYRLCRRNRGNIHFNGQFFRFNGGDIYISGRDLIICREGRRTTNTPGWRVTELNLYRDRTSRREAIEACRSVGRIPLP